MKTEVLIRPQPGFSPAPGIPDIIYSRMAQQAQCAYTGYDFDPTSASAGPTNCGTTVLGHPCSLVALPFNKWKVETDQDYQGGSCYNSPTYLSSIRVNAALCTLPQVAPTPSSSPEIALADFLQANGTSLDQFFALESSDPLAAKKIVNTMPPALLSAIQAEQSSNTSQTSQGYKNCVYFRTNTQNGETERTWQRGAWLQAMAFYTGQVLNEITCNHAVQVNADPNVDGCAIFAQDAIGMYNSAVNTASKVMPSGLPSGTPMAQASVVPDIDFCKADWSIPSLTPQGVSITDPGRLRQASQSLCAARTHLETMFTYLAVCEIFQRTRANYDQVIGLSAANKEANFLNYVVNGSPNPNPALTIPFTSSIKSQCVNACQKNSNYNQDYGKASECMNTCYQQNIQNDYQIFLQNPHLWPVGQPNNCTTPGGFPYSFPTSSNSSHDSSWLGFSILVGSLRRRSNKRRPGIRHRKSLRKYLGYLVLLILAGCGGKATNLPPVPTTDNSPCPGGNSVCCQANPPASANCPTDNAGGGAQAGTGVSGAAEVTNTGTYVGQAQTFASGANGSTNGYSAEGGASPAPAAGAASAGGGSGAQGSPYWGSNPGGGSGTGSSGGSGSGSSSSGLDGSGNTTTAAASPGPAISAGPDSVKAMEASYSGGGGAGGAAGAKSGSGFLYGNGLVGGGAGGDVGFGKTGGPAASGDADPDDYFQRIGYEADIFREVTKVYEKTSTSWAAQNAHVPASNEMSDAGAATAGQPKAPPQPQK